MFISRVFERGEPAFGVLRANISEFLPFPRSVIALALQEAAPLSFVYECIDPATQQPRIVGVVVAVSMQTKARSEALWSREERARLVSRFQPMFTIIDTSYESLTHRGAGPSGDEKRAATKEANITFLAVDPAYSGRGIGKMLAARCLEQLREAGYEVAWVEASHSGSSRVFQSVGGRVLVRVPYDRFEMTGTDGKCYQPFPGLQEAMDIIRIDIARAPQPKQQQQR
jgi:ribosomal protein S18 acetylase RimI-like enzyme